MAFKQKGFPMHKTASALKQTRQASPMKFTGVYEMNPVSGEKDKQISTDKSNTITSVQKKANEMMDKQDLDYDDPRIKKLYKDNGLSFHKYVDSGGEMVLEYTGMDIYTNPNSPDYDPNIKTEEDVVRKWNSPRANTMKSFKETEKLGADMEYIRSPEGKADRRRQDILDE